VEGVDRVELDQLERAIAALDERRADLGDAVVESALGPMRQRLAELATSRRSRRRQVTVLFADLSGYTSLVEKLDPEWVGELVDRVWGELGGVIVAHGGRVLQHLGDGIMALWGDERSNEDDAEQAARAGLAMLDALANLEIDRVRTGMLRLRVGVNTGLVQVGHVGVTDEFRATGDTVNVAARLESSAEPGTVLISRSTYHQVRGVFDVSLVGDLELKGRSEPVTAYRIDRLRPRAFRVRARGFEGLETRMVGRGPHLSRIVEAHRTTTESGEPRLVVASGEPGIGKSRLLYEYRDWIETESTIRVRWFEARCRPDTAERPLGVIRDMFARRFEISDDDDPAAVEQKLEAGLADIVDQADHLPATLGWLLGFAPNPGEEDRNALNMRRKLALDELADVLARLGAEMPVVAVLEDLQWADTNSLDLLERVFADRPGSLLVVATTRPGLGDDRPRWLEQDGLGSGHEVVPLEQLGPDEVRELVRHILRYAERVPESLVARVVEHSDGNPFHVEELIKILIDDGVISTWPDWAVDEERLRDYRVPDTLTGVLQARLDRLPAEQFHALQRASVFGRAFWQEAVAALSDEAGDVGTALSGLVDAELVFPRTPSRFQRTSELAFKHEFTRGVAYDTIALSERPELHRRAAAWLEQNAGLRTGELALEIARHHDLGEDRAAAFEWYSRAARHAENQSAYNEATRLWQQASDRADSDQDRSNALVSLSYALVVIGELEQARALLLDLQRAPETGDADALATQMFVRAELARIAIFLDGDLAQARELLTEGLAMASGEETMKAELMLRHQLGNLAIWRGEFADAIRIHEENVERAGEGSQFYRRGWGLNSFCYALTHSGELDRAMTVADRVIRAADELGDPRLRMGGIAQKGLVALKREQWAEALAWFGEAQDLNRRNGDPEKVSTVANYLGEAALGAGQVERAVTEFSEALEIGRRASAVPEQLRALGGLAAAAAATGDRALGEEGLAMVATDPAAHSEVRRLVHDASERYGLTIGEPAQERAEVVARLEALAEPRVERREIS
jgi:class 3 adenylate cyclase/tetratricopeptide (TPR) repeat protein